MEKTTGAVSLLNLTAQAGLNTLPNIGKVEQSTGEISFADAFMKTSEVKPLENTAGDVSKTKPVIATTAGSNKNIKTAEHVGGQNKESLDENKIEKIAEKVSKAVEEIEDKIKSEFDVSDEDIEEAMEVLGLTAQNLFNATDLRSLVMELTETADSIELLTNVELYDGLKEVTSLAENLLNEVSEEFNIQTPQLVEMINEESFETVLNQVTETENLETDKAIDVKVEFTDGTEAEYENVDSEKITEAGVKEISVEDKEILEDVKPLVKDEKEATDEKPVEVKVEVEKLEGTRTSDPIVIETPAKQNDSMNQNTGSKKQNLFDNTKGQDVNLTGTQTVTTQTVNTVGDIVETVTSYSTSNAENIMRQVTEYVRVNITEDVTKMEMQLHPASLGTVNMQINSQNGQITAHLTVQNELVKSVLESQMIKLQETFNEQGTKVTAIEVSVANYNLDAKSDNNYSQERDRSQSGSKRKSINLNEISSFDELTDEELLEAEVMEMNGSSVNYTA